MRTITLQVRIFYCSVKQGGIEVRFPVVYRGQEAGWVEVEVGQHGALHFRAESTLHTSLVLRLYGMMQQKLLLIGVLEPGNGVLHLERRMTSIALQRAGIHKVPTIYYLEDGKPGCRPEQHPDETTPERTGDSLLDRLIASGAVTCIAEDTGWIIRVPFAAGKEQAMNFALSACTLEQCEGQLTAVLRKQKSP